MKIAYISPHPVPSKAAIAVHVMKMSQALARARHEVTLVYPQPQEKPETSVFKQYGVEEIFSLRQGKKRKGRAGLALYALKNIRAIKAAGTDLVFSRCLLSAYLASVFGLRTLFEIHDSPGEQDAPGRIVFNRLTRSKNFAGLIVISQALKDHIVKNFDVPAGKIIVAADGADPLPPAQGAAPFEKTPVRLQAGYTGHLYKGRGIDVIATMSRAMPGVDFHIVGGTPEDISYWQDECRDCANMIFHGYVPHGEVGRYLQNFDVLLAPYQKKVSVHGNAGDTAAWMSPLKIFEYMSSGKPMICSDMPVLREVLHHGENAVLCDPEDTQQWIQALENLENNPEETRRIGASAQKEFLERYTWQKRAEYIIAALKMG